MSGLLDRIEKIEKSVDMLSGLVSRMDKVLQFTATKAAGVESVAARLGDMLSSLSAELVDVKVVSSDAILDRIRKKEDEQSTVKVNSLLGAKMIATSDVSDDNSLIAVSQVLVDSETSSIKTLSGHNLIAIGSEALDPEWKKSFVGKKAGDTITHAVGDKETEIFTVLDVYSFLPPETGTVDGDTPNLPIQPSEPDSEVPDEALFSEK